MTSPTHVARIGIQRPLVVSDRFLLDKGPAGPLVERLEAGGASVAVFGEVQPDPTLDNVEGALQALRDHEADGVVAIGGGSPMDTAKAAAVAFANEGDLRDYAGYNQVPGPGCRSSRCRRRRGRAARSRAWRSSPTPTAT